MQPGTVVNPASDSDRGVGLGFSAFLVEADMPRGRKSRQSESPQLDWTSRRWDPRRRNQGVSDLCAVIQSVVIIEGMEWAFNKRSLDLSEQQIIEAFYIPKGGLKMKNLKQQYRKHPWITTIDNYPVNIKDEEYVRERYNPEKVSAPMVGVGGWKKVTPGPDGNLEKALLEAVKTQPVLAFIASESDEFGDYIGDEVFTQNITKKPINHAVVVIGYGSNFWRLLNCWGPDWGNNGTMRMIRGKGLCGIGRECYVPVPFDKWQSEMEKESKEKDNKEKGEKRDKGKRDPVYKPSWKRVKRGR